MVNKYKSILTLLILVTLFLSCSSNKEKNEFTNAVLRDGFKHYNKFIVNYPKSSLVITAQQRIYALEVEKAIEEFLKYQKWDRYRSQLHLYKTIKYMPIPKTAPSGAEYMENIKSLVDITKKYSKDGKYSKLFIEGEFSYSVNNISDSLKLMTDNLIEYENTNIKMLSLINDLDASKREGQILIRSASNSLVEIWYRKFAPDTYENATQCLNNIESFRSMLRDKFPYQ